VRPEALLALSGAGGHSCASAAEAARGAARAVLFVVNGKQAEQVLFGPGGIGETATEGMTIMSCVTMSPDEAWRAMEPLTQLGISLGELNVEIDVPRPIELLGIPAGRTSVQRLFYWHVAKAFFHPELTFDEMNHINFDWYAPANAHRQTSEEVRRWCSEAGLEVEHEVLEDAGITVIARKRR